QASLRFFYSRAHGSRLADTHPVVSEWLSYFQKLERLRSRLPLLPLGGHEACAVVAVGFESVVRGAPEFDVVSSVCTPFGPRLPVSELQATSRVAAVPVFADEATAPIVAWPYLSTHRDRQMASPFSGWGRLVCSCSRHSRFRSDAGLTLVDLIQQGVEGAFDDRGHVAFRDLMAQQIAELLEFVAGTLVDGELQFEAPRSKRPRARIAFVRTWGRGRLDCSTLRFARRGGCSIAG